MRSTLIRCVLAGVLTLSAAGAYAEDTTPQNRDSALLVSPLAGWLRNEVTHTGSPGSPARVSVDESPEYGLFLMHASPRLIVNDTLFYSDVNDAEVWGNVATVNAYGDPGARVTWHLGGSYLWHSIDGNTADITVSEPLAKVGVMLRVPEFHLSVNPYLGYAWQHVETTITMPGMSLTEAENADSMIYGVSAYWRWRMLYANAKYYLEDDLDRDEQNHVFRFWGCAMLTAHAGVLARYERTEQFSTQDTSVLVGPVFVF